MATVRPNRTVGSITPLATKEQSLALISVCRCCRRSGASGNVSVQFETNLLEDTLQEFELVRLQGVEWRPFLVLSRPHVTRRRPV